VGVTLRALLEDYLSRHAEARPQLLDEAGRLHQNVMVLIDGRQLVDREKLSDPVAAASEVYVMQASSDE
jgi:molybdopterin synthase sulfur carrier subunit